MEYLHFYITEGTASLTPTYDKRYATLEYSFNKTDWTTVTTNSPIDLVPDKKIYFKGNIKDYLDDGPSFIHFKGDGYPIYAGGSIMSISKENPDETNLIHLNAFNQTFMYFKNLVTPPELPATRLTKGCYKDMFLGCESLTTAPELPATVLEVGCYNGMFSYCKSLTTAPELPATKLDEGCYMEMFRYCISLVTAPELPATELYSYCYAGMFSNCKSLVTAPELPATILSNYCYNSMFTSCTSLVNAPNLPATDISGSCYRGMFYNCESLTTAPELPATSLYTKCYEHMFKGCSSLVNAPSLPAKTLADYCYNGMFSYCTSIEKAPDLPATEPVDAYNNPVENCYNEMFGECSKLNYVKCLLKPGTTACTTDWLIGVASNGTFVKNKDFDNWERSGNGIPTGWTVENSKDGEVYTITVTSNDSEHCSVFGNGQYIYGAKATIKCVPLAGYEFVQWNDGNTYATREVIVTSDATYTATIRKLITVTLNGDNCTLTGAGYYSYGTSVQISCVPNELYEFVQWSDGNTNATRAITVTEDITLTAVTRAITSNILQIKARKGTDDFVRTVVWYIDYKGGTFSWDAKVETDFDNLTTNVEISDNRVTNISKGSSWVGDGRIYSFDMTVPRNDSDTNKEFTINISSTNIILSDSITVRVVQRPKLPVLIEDIFVSSGDVENALVTIPDTMGEVLVVYEDETLARYTIDDCVSNYVLYYRNALGGIDLFPVTGKVIKSNDIEHLTINKKYDNRTSNFGNTNYENILTERWQLYSGRLTDQQSKLMHHLINSTYVYLYDIQADKFTPVVITDTEMEYKTYKNNNNKMVYYTINVEASQTKYRR